MTARTAVLVAFALNGALYGSWAGRVPALAAQVRTNPGGLGLALLGTSIGMIIAAVLAGRACAAVGSRRVVLTGALGAAVVVPLLGLAPTVPLLGLSLAVLGMMVGALDVGMNVAATTVVRQLDRPMMPTFHAFFSFGGLTGALGAGLAAAAGLTPAQHLSIVAALAVLATLLVARALPVEPPPADDEPVRVRTADLLRRPLLWLLAAVALCSAIAEGVSAEWSALFLVSERGVGQAVAATAYSAFSVAMALTRLFGERAQRRWGPHRVLVGGASVAAAGILLAALVPLAAFGYLGFALAGVGLAYCFPVALMLASDAGRRADGTGGAPELSFVTAIAYSGFLAGPPLVGGIAQASSLIVALAVVGGIVALIPVAVRLGMRAAERERTSGTRGAPYAR